jgi:hypothetical protein
MMLSALSIYENPTAVFNRHTAGLDIDLFSDLSNRKVAAPANPGVFYALPITHATLQTTEEVMCEAVAAYARNVRLGESSRGAFSAFRSALSLMGWGQPIEISESNSLWLANVNDPDAPGTVPAVYKTISAVLKAIKEDGGLRQINETLKRVNTSTASAHHSVAVLRTLSSHKDHLPQWWTMRNDLQRSLDARQKALNIDPRVAMRGLWQDE